MIRQGLVVLATVLGSVSFAQSQTGALQVDPFSPNSCVGPALTNVRRYFASGANSATFGNYQLSVRSRQCTMATGCSGWRADELSYDSDGKNLTAARGHTLALTKPDGRFALKIYFEPESALRVEGDLQATPQKFTILPFSGLSFWSKTGGTGLSGPLNLEGSMRDGCARFYGLVRTQVNSHTGLYIDTEVVLLGLH